jgi:hypothetical protein
VEQETEPPPAVLEDNPLAFDSPPAPTGNLDFRSVPDPIDAGLRRRMRGAATLLLWALGYALLVSVVTVVMALLQLIALPEARTYARNPYEGGPNYGAHIVGLLVRCVWIAFSVVLPGVFVFLGARALKSIRSRGLMIAGGICCILLGLQGSIGCLEGLASLLPNRSDGEGLKEMFFWFDLCVGFLFFIQVALCLGAGIRALLLVSQPQTAEAIHASAERLRSARETLN